MTNAVQLRCAAVFVGKLTNKNRTKFTATLNNNKTEQQQTEHWQRRRNNEQDVAWQRFCSYLCFPFSVFLFNFLNYLTFC